MPLIPPLPSTDFVVALPTEGAEALSDRTDVTVFGRGEVGHGGSQ
jgi:hypothetical protein